MISKTWNSGDDGDGDDNDDDDNYGITTLTIVN